MLVGGPSEGIAEASGQLVGDFHLFETGSEALVRVELPEPPAEELETFEFEEPVEVGSKFWDGSNWHYRGPHFKGTVVHSPRQLGDGEVYVLPELGPLKEPMIFTRRRRPNLIVHHDNDGIDPHPSIIDRQPQPIPTTADQKVLACRVISRRVLPQAEVLFNL